MPGGFTTRCARRPWPGATHGGSAVPVRVDREATAAQLEKAEAAWMELLES